jgi:hypothetical protein
VWREATRIAPKQAGHQWKRIMDYFSRRAKRNFEEHVVPAFKGEVVRYLEIGVWQGHSLEWMLKNVLTHDESYAMAVDPWLPMQHGRRQ